MADETDSKSVVSNGVWVRVPPPAVSFTRKSIISDFRVFSWKTRKCKAIMMSLENRENMYDTDEFYHLEKIFVGLIIAAAILIGVVFGFFIDHTRIPRIVFGAVGATSVISSLAGIILINSLQLGYCDNALPVRILLIVSAGLMVCFLVLAVIGLCI